MILDSHLHFGNVVRFDLTEKILIDSMNKYNIDSGLISNIEAIEYDFDGNPVFIINQYDANMKTVLLCRKYPDRLKGLFWIKPKTEILNDKTKELIIENRDVIVGLKVHPYHSKIKITDKLCIPYLEFAKEYNLPVAVHTAKDGVSNSKYLNEVALKYPTVKFIAVHMDLRSDNIEAAGYVKNTANLYGDTTWVDNGEKVEWLIKNCGADKILFGSDAPIDGIDTYLSYKEMIEHLKKCLSISDFNKVFYENAIKLFNLG